MKKFIIALTAVVFLLGGITLSHASDWDKAGKILTGITGLRLITGGRVDVVGTLLGVGHRREREVYKPHNKHHKNRQYAKHYSSCKRRVWVPHYEWEKKHIHAHEEYDDQLGKIYVEEHYIKYQVEVGGHWEKTYFCH